MLLPGWRVCTGLGIHCFALPMFGSEIPVFPCRLGRYSICLAASQYVLSVGLWETRVGVPTGTSPVVFIAVKKRPLLPARHCFSPARSLCIGDFSGWGADVPPTHCGCSKIFCRSTLSSPFSLFRKVGLGTLAASLRPSFLALERSREPRMELNQSTLAPIFSG